MTMNINKLQNTTREQKRCSKENTSIAQLSTTIYSHTFNWRDVQSIHWSDGIYCGSFKSTVHCEWRRWRKLEHSSEKILKATHAHLHILKYRIQLHSLHYEDARWKWLSFEHTVLVHVHVVCENALSVNASSGLFPPTLHRQYYIYEKNWASHLVLISECK